ncbi:hypothetical protein [Chitinophaga sp. MM2321]|uniref:hypothetical protein n=1 Tax=Chitinophaga sp. MM2321 TaxID=3137178 RepID=UPI0032D57169
MKSYFSTNRVLAYTFTGVAIATFFFACKKEVTTDTAVTNEQDNHTMAVASHEAQVNGIYGDLFETAVSAAATQGVDSRQSGKDAKDLADAAPCPSVLLLGVTDPNQWPKEIVVEYGPACRDNYGVTRSGMVHISMTGLLFKTGTRVTITLEDYKVNNIPVTGVNSIYDISYSPVTGVQYTTEVTDGNVHLSDSLILGYTGKKTVKQIEGGSTPMNPSDDVYSIDGNATITYEKGAPGGEAAVATISTVTPVLKGWSCKWISQGELKVEFNKITGVIDYGKGMCDSLATITVNDKMKDIVLP